MRKISLFFVLLLAGSIGLFAGCSSSTQYKDGVYTAQVENFDSYGYKDFLTVTVENGVVVDMVFNSLDSNGKLLTDDDKYRKNMEAINDTYPEKYAADLVNQYLEQQNIDKVEAVAGATYSSNSFKALYAALQKNMQNGDTTLVIVPNVPEE